MKRVWKLQCEFADGKVDARARLYVIWLLKFYIVKKAAYVIFIVFFFFFLFLILILVTRFITHANDFFSLLLPNAHIYVVFFFKIEIC